MILLTPFLSSVAAYGTKTDSYDDFRREILKSPEAVELWTRMDVLLVEEASMLAGECTSYVFRFSAEVRPANVPPLRMILCGDLFQLGPILRKSKGRGAWKAFDASEHDFFFECPEWEQLKFRVIILRKSFRHRDPLFEFVNEEVRRGEVSIETARMLELLEEVDRIESVGGSADWTVLFGTNSESDRYNEMKLRSIDGEHMDFYCSDRRSSSPGVNNAAVQSFFRNCQGKKLVRLKVGCKIVVLKNLHQRSGIVNGASGHVVRFDYGSSKAGSTRRLYPVCRIRGLDTRAVLEDPDYDPKTSAFEVLPEGRHDEVLFKHADWTLKSSDGSSFPETLATRSCVPIKLAYSVTGHKSQGMGIEPVVADLSHVFEYGQAYAMISRGTSFRTTKIKNFRRNKCLAHPAVKEFYARYESTERSREEILHLVEMKRLRAAMILSLKEKLKRSEDSNKRRRLLGGPAPAGFVSAADLL